MTEMEMILLIGEQRSRGSFPFSDQDRENDWYQTATPRILVARKGKYEIY
jgi:hypothetical protein